MGVVHVTRRSFRRAGRVVPLNAKRFRGRSVKLIPGGAVPWHSTGKREEILLGVKGRLILEIQNGPRPAKRVTLAKGQCMFVPQATRHRVVNRSRRAAQYLYVTA